jgi:hypothetical protein
MTMHLEELPFHFEKKAGKTIKGGRLDWEKAILDMLSETAPYVVQGGNEITVQWDEMDPETGYALGKVVVFNRPPLPPVLPGQMDQMRNAGIQDPGKAVTIPVYVKDHELSDVDIFVDEEGAAHSLTEKRWHEHMGTPDVFGAVDPNVNPMAIRAQNPTYQMPSGAAGYDRMGHQGFGSYEKTSMIKEALGKEGHATLDPVDVNRMKHVAKHASILAGFGRTRVFPVVKLILGSPTSGMPEYEDDALATLPINLILVQEIDGHAVRSLRYRVTMVSDRYYRPKIAEGDYRFVVNLLKDVIPDISQRLMKPGDHVLSIGRQSKASPMVLEDLSFGAERVLGRGSFLVLDRGGESLMQADVVPNVFEWNGQPSGHKLVIGPRVWAMCSEVAGRRIGEFGSSVAVARSDGHVERGYWVSLVMGSPIDPDAQWMVPCKVIWDGRVEPRWADGKDPANPVPASGGVPAVGSPMGSDASKRRVVHLTTYGGESLAVMFTPGIKKAMPCSGARWPDIDLDDGCSRWLVPADTTTIVDLGIPTVVETDPHCAEHFIGDHVRTNSAIKGGEGRIRFVKDDDAEQPRMLTMEYHGVGGGFVQRGEILRGSTGQNVETDLTRTQAIFNLMVLGCDQAQAEGLVAKAESRGRITITNLRPTERFIDVDGTRRVPFFRKTAEISMQIRTEIEGDVRDTLFKAAAAIPFGDLSKPVQAYLSDDGARKKLAFLGSQMSKVKGYGTAGIQKVAEIFAEPDSVDVMLGLNILNERNVKTFLRHLDRLRRVEDNLAELLMMSRQGLAGLESRDCSEAMTALNKVNEKLENLKMQLGSDALILA